MKNPKYKAAQKAFTLIELLIVIAIVGILAGATLPALSGARQAGMRNKDASNIRQICIGLRTFSAENDGLFPSFDPDADEDESGDEDSSFSTSTEAFNVLIPDYVDTESVFWIANKQPQKRRAPEEDGELEDDECVYGYTAGLLDSDYSLCPLVFDGFMDTPGAVNEHHPWLNKKKIVVGYVDGHVEQNELTGKTPGSTVRSLDKRVDNIFEEREQSDDGKNSGGYLVTSQSNVLLPGQ